MTWSCRIRLGKSFLVGQGSLLDKVPCWTRFLVGQG